MAALAGLLAAACSVIGVRDTPEPSYAVVERLSEEVEIRRYPPRVAAEASLPEPDANRAFRLLFDYISGGNEGDRKIAMTAPVAEAPAAPIPMTVPVAETRGPGGYAMRFFLPDGMTAETAPRPSDPRVTLVSLPEATVATRRFAGLRGDASIARETDRLLAALEVSDWRPTAPAQAWFYDPPWTLPPFRRNEVAVPVEPRR